MAVEILLVEDYTPDANLTVEALARRARPERRPRSKGRRRGNTLFTAAGQIQERASAALRHPGSQTSRSWTDEKCWSEMKADPELQKHPRDRGHRRGERRRSRQHVRSPGGLRDPQTGGRRQYFQRSPVAQGTLAAFCRASESRGQLAGSPRFTPFLRRTFLRYFVDRSLLHDQPGAHPLENPIAQRDRRAKQCTAGISSLSWGLKKSAASGRRAVTARLS